MSINIPGIDIDKAVKNSGSYELFTELLGDVYKLMDDKVALTQKYLADKDLHNYTIQVHSLKTTCRMIGAMELGEDFYSLEKLGKEGDLGQLLELTPAVLDSFKALKPYLEPYAGQNYAAHKVFDKNKVSGYLKELLAAIDDFDLSAAEEAARQLMAYDCSRELSEELKILDGLISNLDYDEARALSMQILSGL
ncbi:Hpt domain-containing protein [Butyrivibrio sp. MC2013]|uniref:Hpt domain-containing protein n=1 Tax=Butyrivibrio sp. MC2013 TaxID=1280686 RepID=UPI000422FDFC|nr:hypothetical protein [Butyrivibrio sp. MC2013]